MNQQLQELIEKKDKLENEFTDLQEKMTFFQSKNLHKDLVDSEGFPRDDIDFGEITEYRNTKRRMEEIKNDLRQLIREIEENLIKFHEESKIQAEKDIQEYEQNIEYREIQKQTEKLTLEEQKFIPFAQINEVTEESPSWEAGLMVNDYIVDFNEANISNHQNLQILPVIVKKNIDRDIRVRVLRKFNNQQDVFEYNNEKYGVKEMIIHPKYWKGVGYLGCRFKQI